jgi:hypothetical protein
LLANAEVTDAGKLPASYTQKISLTGDAIANSLWVKAHLFFQSSPSQ